MEIALDMSQQGEVDEGEEGSVKEVNLTISSSEGEKMNPWVKRILIILGILIAIGGIWYWVYVAP
jgi:hypothetical protein